MERGEWQFVTALLYRVSVHHHLLIIIAVHYHPRRALVRIASSGSGVFAFVTLGRFSEISRLSTFPPRLQFHMVEHLCQFSLMLVSVAAERGTISFRH